MYNSINICPPHLFLGIFAFAISMISITVTSGVVIVFITTPIIFNYLLLNLLMFAPSSYIHYPPIQHVIPIKWLYAFVFRLC